MAKNNKPRQSKSTGKALRHTRTPARAPAPSTVVVYATFPDREAALVVGRALVEARIAGCVNVLPTMTSVYVWKGRTETADEAVLLAKLPAAGAQAAIAFIKMRHSYETPAILALPVAAGFQPYLDWLAEGVDVA